MTNRTGSLPAVAGQHYAVLYLVLVLPQHLKEIIDAHVVLA